MNAKMFFQRFEKRAMLDGDEPLLIKALVYILFLFVPIVVVAAVLYGAVSVSVPYFGGNSTARAEGDISGVVVDFCQDGRFWKTLEGNLVIGGSTAAGKHLFRFSVPDPAVALQIDSALRSGAMVRLHYRQVWYRDAYKADTDYYIESVEPIVGEKSAEKGGGN